MVVNTLEKCFAKWDYDRFKMPIFAKKSYFQMTPILILAGMETNKIVAFRAQKTRTLTFEKSTHPKRVTVWCGYWSRGIIGPLFFENEQGEAVAVNGNRYRAMLNEFLSTKIEEEDIVNIWF